MNNGNRGYQQTTIAASAEAVKNAAVSQLSRQGWAVNSDGPFHVVFVRPRSAGMQFLAALGTANGTGGTSSGCAPEARVFLTMNFSEADGQTFVTSEEELSSPGSRPSCQINMMIDHTNGARKKQDAILAAIKKAAESSQTAAPATSK